MAPENLSYRRYAVMNPNEPIVLTGKSAKAFEKYQKKKGTKEEIAYFKKAEKYYLRHCPKPAQLTTRK